MAENRPLEYSCFHSCCSRGLSFVHQCPSLSNTESLMKNRTWKRLLLLSGPNNSYIKRCFLQGVMLLL